MVRTNTKFMFGFAKLKKKLGEKVNHQIELSSFSNNSKLCVDKAIKFCIEMMKT